MANELTLVFAGNVRRLMKLREWTLVELGRRSGVSKSALGYLVNYQDQNDRHPNIKQIEGIALAAGLPAPLLLSPDVPDDVLAGRSAATLPDQGDSAPPALDADLLAKSIEIAITAFRSEQRSPSDKALAAAATFVYAKVSTGVRVKQAEKAVKELLAQSAGKNEVLSV